MRVDETIALAALIQATIAKLYKLYTANQGFRLYRRALIMENKWRAARYGLDGKLIDFGKQTEVPARELIWNIWSSSTTWWTNWTPRRDRLHP